MNSADRTSSYIPSGYPAGDRSSIPAEQYVPTPRNKPQGYTPSASYTPVPTFFPSYTSVVPFDPSKAPSRHYSKLQGAELHRSEPSKKRSSPSDSEEANKRKATDDKLMKLRRTEIQTLQEKMKSLPKDSDELKETQFRRYKLMSEDQEDVIILLKEKNAALEGDVLSYKQSLLASQRASQSKVKDSLDKIDELNRLVSSTKQGASDARAELALQKAEKYKAIDDLKNARSELEKSSGTRAKLESHNKDKDHKIEQFKEEAQKASTEFKKLQDDLRKERTEAKEKSQQVEKDREMLRKAVQDLENQKLDLMAQNQKLQQAQAEVNAKTALEKTTSQELVRNAIEKLNAEITGLQAQNTNLTGRIEQLEAQKEQYRLMLAGAVDHNQYQELQKRLTDLDKEQNALKIQNHQLNELNGQLREKLKKANETVRELRLATIDFSARILGATQNLET